MSHGFSNFSDDFFINVDLHTSLTLPQERETVLHFCEAIQKQFHDLSDFYQRDGGEHVLEGERQTGSYRWLEIDTRRMSSGAFNPGDLEAAYNYHAWLLDRSRFFLGISHLDVESLDLIYGFNLDYAGNRDRIVCEALLEGSRLATLLTETDALPVNYEPSLIVALDEDCALQARLVVETRTNSYMIRTGHYEQEPISVYVTLRHYQKPAERFDMAASLARQREMGEELLTETIIPNVVRPIASAIAAAQ